MHVKIQYSDLRRILYVRFSYLDMHQVFAIRMCKRCCSDRDELRLIPAQPWGLSLVGARVVRHPVPGQRCLSRVNSMPRCAQLGELDLQQATSNKRQGHGTLMSRSVQLVSLCCPWCNLLDRRPCCAVPCPAGPGGMWCKAMEEITCNVLHNINDIM